MYYIIHKKSESIFLSNFKDKVLELIYAKCSGLSDDNFSYHYFFNIKNNDYDWKQHISQIEKELIKYNIHYSKTCDCDIIELDSKRYNTNKLYVFNWGFCCN